MANVKDDDKQKIEKLRGVSNWFNWKDEIRYLLMERELEEYVFEEMPANCVGSQELAPPVDGQPARIATTYTLEGLNWVKKSKKALGIIALNIEVSQRPYIQAVTTGREAWLKLSSLYDNKDEATKLAREFEFMSRRQDAEENVAHWISRVEGERAKCVATGVNIEENRAISVCLNGLKPAFHVKRKL